MSESARYSDVERQVCAAVSPELERVPDEETELFDARLAADVAASAELTVIGRVVVEADSPVEIKTCQKWIGDNGSSGSRRRGCWHITVGRHAELGRIGGVYLLVVRDGEELLEAALVDALALDALVDDRATETGSTEPFRDRRATVPWREVFDDDQLEEPVADADAIAAITEGSA